MKISDSYNDSNPGSKLRRIFYTVELEDGVYVDIMVSEENQVVYAMQNEDGSTVYDSKDTCPSYIYDEKEAKKIAIEAYEKEYGIIKEKEKWEI